MWLGFLLRNIRDLSESFALDCRVADTDRSRAPELSTFANRPPARRRPQSLCHQPSLHANFGLGQPPMDKASQHFHLKPMCDHKQMPGSATRIAGEKL